MDALEAGQVTPETAESHIRAASGDIDSPRRARERARNTGEAIADEEDRLYFLRWFDGGNWHGLAVGAPEPLQTRGHSW